MSDTDAHHLADVLRIKKRRLKILERKIATLGYTSAPPELITERDDLKDELETDKQALEPVIDGSLSQDALAALRAYGLQPAVASAMQNLEARFWELKRDLTELRDKLLKQREQDAKDRDEHMKRDTIDRDLRQLKTDEQRIQMREQLITITLYVRLIIGALIVGAVGMALYFFFR